MHVPTTSYQAEQGFCHVHLFPRVKCLVLQLMRIEEEGSFVGRMDSMTDPSTAYKQKLDSMQLRRVTSQVANVTRLKRRLDWRISQLASRPMNQLHPVLLQILRLCKPFPLMSQCKVSLPD